MTIKQVSVFLANRPGALNSFTKILTENGIDMRALSLAETSEFGIARVIVDDPYKTANVIREAGYISNLTDVVAAAIPDVSGGLNSVLNVLTQNDVNIQYMYAFLGGPKSDQAYMIFKVDEPKTASAVLGNAGIRTATQEELSSL
ncbi:MAG: acetolactate synthase [Lachnospiraceae bacterium]|nr:acetolactate synthase [Lachnospiraceae bacterium]MBQ1415374.1 acetolactate synthase [Lachnospiraceae bacterium]MBQ4308721.1 acetolactate synthase [Lachnospiraceae bacterium]MCR5538663.1 acetolactate synthase [Lachnospiraceae bacterium]